MIDRADIVVVGGGILGASVAHFLSKKDIGKVILIEKGAVCTGATKYSAANVRQHYSNEVCIRLAVRAVEMFHDAEAELGGEVGFVECGYMVVAPEGQEAGLRAVVPLQQRLGVETKLLGQAELAERFPELDVDGLAVAALEPKSGYADPCKTVNALVASAETRGLVVYEETQVSGIGTGSSGVTGVETNRGRIGTSVVVNAAGPWAAKVGAMVGVEYRLSLSREHEVVVQLPTDFGELPIVSDAAQGIFFRPYGRDCLLVGEGYPKEQEPCDPDTYNPRADEAVIERMLTRLRRRVPKLVEPPRKTDYAGVYSITDDWYPIVGGDAGVEGYYAAVGGSGHSFKIGPPIGEALADIIAGSEPAIDISALEHQRFARDERFQSVWGPGNRG